MFHESSHKKPNKRPGILIQPQSHLKLAIYWMKLQFMIDLWKGKTVFSHLGKALFLEYVCEGVMVSPWICKLCIRCRWAISLMKMLLYPLGKSPCCLLDGNLVEPQIRSGLQWRSEQFCPWKESNPDAMIFQPVPNCCTDPQLFFV